MEDTMPELGDALLDRMVRTLVDAADPEQVVLFGSRARGDARPHSDVDLLVVESEPFGPGRSRDAETARLCRALPETPVGRDLLVYSRDEIEYWRGSRNHVAARALREGRVLYAKDRGADGSGEAAGGGAGVGRRVLYAKDRGADGARAPTTPSRADRNGARGRYARASSSTGRSSRVRDGGPARPDVDQARLLLDLADGDVGLLRVTCDSAEVSDEGFGFHVQQAAEKCFKAWIALLGDEYPLTHNLRHLLDWIGRREGAVPPFTDLARFSAFAVHYRYARRAEDAAPIDRPAAIRRVEALRRRVEDLLPPKTPPRQP